MARQSSLLNAVFNIASSIHWTFSVAIAVLAYFGFHFLANLPVPAPGSVQDLADNTVRHFIRVFSFFFQYAVPAIFSFGAILSFVRSLRQRKLHAEVAAGGDRAALESISWSDFEILTSEVFRRKGFSVRRRGGNGADGGIDLEMWQGKDRYLCQCKQWKSTKVGVNVVRELFGVMSAEGAAGGFVVASGGFTKEAEKFAQGRSIELVSTDLMLRLVSQTNDESNERTGNSMDTPACPSCGSEMILRRAKKGDNAGGSFWGCSNYPRCRGIRPAR